MDLGSVGQLAFGFGDLCDHLVVEDFFEFIEATVNDDGVESAMIKGHLNG